MDIFFHFSCSDRPNAGRDGNITKSKILVRKFPESLIGHQSIDLTIIIYAYEKLSKQN